MHRNVLFVVLSLSLAGSAVVACSGDDSSTPTPTVDSGTDTGLPGTDAGKDSNTADSNVQDSNVADTNVADTNTSDAHTDAGSDAATDASDAASDVNLIPDVLIDVVLPIDAGNG